MKSPRAVENILAHYDGSPPGVKGNLRRILLQGRLGGTGKLVILPVDQGFEHGPARSFAANPAGYDPDYHYRLAIEGGLSALAAPSGLLEAGADRFAGCIPTILKVNSANSLMPSSSPKDQAITAGVPDALRLGCAAIGFTIYPGSSASLAMFEEVASMIREARAHGLASVIWSYPRGEALDKAGELAMDVSAYAAQIAALLGAHIIKVKLPSADLAFEDAREVYIAQDVPLTNAADRVRHVMQGAFAGKRIVVFSGGAKKDSQSVFDDARAIREGGGHGSIIGRNSFQRPREEALAMLGKIIAIYKGRN